MSNLYEITKKILKRQHYLKFESNIEGEFINDTFDIPIVIYTNNANIDISTFDKNFITERQIFLTTDENHTKEEIKVFLSFSLAKCYKNIFDFKYFSCNMDKNKDIVIHMKTFDVLLQKELTEADYKVFRNKNRGIKIKYEEKVGNNFLIYSQKEEYEILYKREYGTKGYKNYKKTYIPYSIDKPFHTEIVKEKN